MFESICSCQNKKQLNGSLKGFLKLMSLIENKMVAWSCHPLLYGGNIESDLYNLRGMTIVWILPFNDLLYRQFEIQFSFFCEMGLMVTVMLLYE